MVPNVNDSVEQKELSPSIHIGTGGWAYFPLEGDKLTQYATKFDIVEVNSTFYQIPRTERVKRWLNRTPSDFIFSVKCHSDVTHQSKLIPTTKAITSLTRIFKICLILNASHLIFQLPPTFEGTPQSLDQIDSFLAEYSLETTIPVIEVRGKGWHNPEIEQGLDQILLKHHAISSNDISRLPTKFPTTNIYSRIFGRGSYNRWEFTYTEIQAFIDQISHSVQQQAVLIFHSIRMYEAAAKSKYYLQNGTFPPRTTVLDNNIDLSLLHSIVFPISQSSLLQQIGWRVIELPTGQQIHFESIFANIKTKRFDNIRELKIEIDTILKNNEVYLNLW